MATFEFYGNLLTQTNQTRQKIHQIVLSGLLDRNNTM